MKTFSISFTLGKASVQHNANIEHNNRKFIAGNINREKVPDNIAYVQQDVQEAYQKLFGKALDEYNSQQKRRDRIIPDYFKHISDSKREEAYYEIIVQFGDSQTAPCGSENGEIAKEMLDEYIRNFKQRNPNLHVFNAVMHMDEASPHLHIDFIPFYTNGRQKGLSKGVSMKAALDEQGFTASNYKENRLVAWEESERLEMEKILNRHGFSRDDKNAKYAHQTVEQYKKSQDEKKMIHALNEMKKINGSEVTEDNIKRLKLKINLMENENNALKSQHLSPFKSFYYSSPEKQAFVQAELDKMNIPYRETENGFEAQDCYVNEIRKLEKNFKPVKTSARGKLREDIDRLVMQSESFEELLSKLKKEKYQVKLGKFIAVRPQNGSQFIRLKSLGEQYSEYALKNRINARKKYEANLQNKINATHDKESMAFIITRTMQFYTITFKRGALPMKRRDSKKPFAWTNDSELDKLLSLNAKINNGATLDSLKRDFENAEHELNEKENQLEKSKKDLKAFRDLKEKIEIVFENRHSEKFTREQAMQTLKRYPNITENNYRNVEKLINQESENLARLDSEVKSAKVILEKTAADYSMAEKICGGTYVQGLVGEERSRRESNFIPNGLKNA